MTERRVANMGLVLMSQSAFVRGFIDDSMGRKICRSGLDGLNPRSCAASSMTRRASSSKPGARSLNPRSCAASSMTSKNVKLFGE